MPDAGAGGAAGGGELLGGGAAEPFAGCVVGFGALPLPVAFVALVAGAFVGGDFAAAPDPDVVAGFVAGAFTLVAGAFVAAAALEGVAGAVFVAGAFVAVAALVLGAGDFVAGAFVDVAALVLGAGDFVAGAFVAVAALVVGAGDFVAGAFVAMVALGDFVTGGADVGVRAGADFIVVVGFVDAVLAGGALLDPAVAFGAAETAGGVGVGFVAGVVVLFVAGVAGVAGGADLIGVPVADIIVGADSFAAGVAGAAPLPAPMPAPSDAAEDSGITGSGFVATGVALISVTCPMNFTIFMRGRGMPRFVGGVPSETNA